MQRYLVVANQTLASSQLAELLEGRGTAGECHFHLVVPATPASEQLTWTEGEAGAVAQRRLDDALARFRGLGLVVDGEVGDASPVQAIRDVLDREAFDEIILSTLPPGPSRWLRQDLPRRVERAFELPVTHVIAERATRAAS